MINKELTADGWKVSIPPALSGSDYFAITPSDTVDFAEPVDGIYIGTAGTVVAVRADGTAVTFKNTIQGTILPISAIRVKSTGTTAADLVGVYNHY